jgi:hypothetical protein
MDSIPNRLMIADSMLIRPDIALSRQDKQPILLFSFEL